MSGWRSGSGRTGDWLDAAIADPTPLLGRDPAARTRTRILLMVLAVIAAAAAVVGAYQASLRPPHRTLPAPIANVLVVPIGAFPGDRLASLPGDYRDEYGLALTIADPIDLDPTAYDATRRQFAAQGLIRALALRHPGGPDGPIVIGVTESDLYIQGVAWNWAFALRLEGRLAVISTARMPNTKYRSRWSLFRKMLTRELGFLAWQLPPTDDPYDLLYRDILGADDLGRVSSHL